MTFRCFRAIFSFPVVLGVVLAVCVCLMLERTANDLDLWWHLRNAEYLVRTHSVIRSDMYSFTVSGAPWINHEWLAEIPFYYSWLAGGLQGIFLLTILLIQAIILGIYYLGYLVSGELKDAFLATWLAIFLATVSFGPRTLLFGWIFLILLLAILWRFKQFKAAPLWTVPFIFLLWVNTHGSWLIGLAIFWIIIISGCVKGFVELDQSQGWSQSQLKRLLATAAASTAVLFVNPYGYRLVAYPFAFALEQKLNVSNIEEWASVDFHSGRGKILLATILLVVTVALVRRRRWSLESLALFLFAVYTSVTYSRFLFLAAIIFVPLLAPRLEILPDYLHEKDRPALNAVAIVAAIAFVIWWFPSEASLARRMQAAYPDQGCGFLQKTISRQPGAVLNDYNWGGYLIWKCRDLPVFIDSRVDIFEANGVLKDYLDFSNRNSLALFDKYNIRYALLRTNTPEAFLLKFAPGWHIAYSDDLATVFLRE